MKIQFKKALDYSILHCIRVDGSSTTEQLEKGLEAHDFMHYAVESTLQLKNSFFGLLAKGHSIQEFALPKEERVTEWPLEAIQTEFIVGFLRQEVIHGNQYENVNEIIRASCQLKEVTPPTEITAQQLHQIRTIVQHLSTKWASTPIGEKMELTF